MNDITELRDVLFAQLAELRGAATGDAEALKSAIAKAAAVSDLAKSIPDTGRLEVDYLRVTGGGESRFLAAPAATGGDGGQDVEREVRELPNGIVRVVQHALRG